MGLLASAASQDASSVGPVQRTVTSAARASVMIRPERVVMLQPEREHLRGCVSRAERGLCFFKPKVSCESCESGQQQQAVKLLDEP